MIGNESRDYMQHAQTQYRFSPSQTPHSHKTHSLPLKSPSVAGFFSIHPSRNRRLPVAGFILIHPSRNRRPLAAPYHLDLRSPDSSPSTPRRHIEDRDSSPSTPRRHIEDRDSSPTTSAMSPNTSRNLTPTGVNERVNRSYSDLFIKDVRHHPLIVFHMPLSLPLSTELSLHFTRLKLQQVSGDGGL